MSEKQDSIYCMHIYEQLLAAICHMCGELTNEHDWHHQNKLNAEWKANNPDIEFAGWTSI